MSVSEVAKELSIYYNSHRWIIEYEQYGKSAFPGHGSALYNSQYEIKSKRPIRTRIEFRYSAWDNCSKSNWSVFRSTWKTLRRFRVGLNPYTYLKFIFQDLPGVQFGQNPEFLDDYLPWNPRIQTICKEGKSWVYLMFFSFLSTILLLSPSIRAAYLAVAVSIMKIRARYQRALA